MNKSTWQDKRIQAGKIFTPRSPITEFDLFAGRIPQAQEALDAIHSPGLHAVIYGERGVGKTSFANVLAPIALRVGTATHSFKVNCGTQDTFSTMWRNALDQIRVIQSQQGAGFNAETRQNVAPMFSLDGNLQLTPHDVLVRLQSLGAASVNFIFDEFDRLPKDQIPQFNDLLKSLSDNGVPATVILVGVADTVEDLIADHGSIERGIVQIHMPRMTVEELREILNKSDEMGLEFDDEAKDFIVSLSQGLPHFCHLLGLYSSRCAIDSESLVVTRKFVQAALAEAVNGVQESIASKYNQAVASTRSDALFKEVLLACAKAETNERSYFWPKDVERPLSLIMGKPYKHTSFASHLTKFCERDRGPVLERGGVRRRYQYRFLNPLMAPYVLMRGHAEGILD